MSAFSQYLSRRFARYPVASLSLAITLLLGIADIFLWRRQAALSEQADRARKDGEAMMLALSSYPRIQGQLAQVNEATASIDDNLASESDLAGNLDYFYQFEKSAHIRLAGISQMSSPSTGGDPNAYRAVAFALRLTGPYNQILAYLRQLETGPRLVRVKSYRFAQTDSMADKLSVDLTVDVLGRP